MQSPPLSRMDRYRYYQICFYSRHPRRREIAFVVVQALFLDSATSCALVGMAKPFGALARLVRNQGWPSKEDNPDRGQGREPLANALR
jgi:hypothetical protein